MTLGRHAPWRPGRDNLRISRVSLYHSDKDRRPLRTLENQFRNHANKNVLRVIK